MSKKSNKRSTTWTFIFYECPEVDWMGEIEDWHVKCIVSPLHDQDVYTETDEKRAKRKGREVEWKAGDLKKPHRHAMVIFESLKSESQVKELIQDLGGYMEVEAVNAPHSMVRYFCHLDTPKKHQYEPADLVAFAGANVEEYLKPSTDEFASTFMEILKYVHSTNQTSLINFLIRCCGENADWYYFCMNQKGFSMVRSIIESQAKKKKDFLAYAKELERECMETGVYEEYDWDEYNNELILKIADTDEDPEKKGEIENENDAKDNGTGKDNTEKGDCEDREGLSDGAGLEQRGEVVPICRPSTGADLKGDGGQGV